MQSILSALVAAALLGPASLAAAADAPAAKAPAADASHAKYAKANKNDLRHARLAILEIQKADPGMSKFFYGAAGYAVFATVGKGAVGVGGAHGTGIVFEEGMAVGEATLNQVTIGLALGGQAFTEVIFFETAKSLADFKRGEFTMAAQVSAVAAAAGASVNARYVEGVSVFTFAKAGLMAEASVGGQKFGYRAFEDSITFGSR
jgi:hypothetical protein